MPQKKPPATPPSEKKKTPTNNVRLPIIGIGASAGGLDAFQRFLANMPADRGIAIILVQHLDPTHESMTASLLDRHSDMPVVEAQDRMPIKADQVYMIPPNKDLTVCDGELRLNTPELHRGIRLPVDCLFRSLAETERENAIGIILAGTGSDGTLGAKAIKAAGGIVLVQSPETTQYDGMPRSAIATGKVDHVAPIEAMPQAVISFLEHSVIEHLQDSDTTGEADPAKLSAILAVLRTRTKQDFRCYKKGTLMRRIGRRMSLNQCTDLEEYAQYLREHPAEVSNLYRDLLIGVTEFFRNIEAFESLAGCIDKIISRKPDDVPIRIWVPGCSTGEEAYGIAMLVNERLTLSEKIAPLQIFATDIDEEALRTARSGVYGESIVAEVSPERLQKFFIKEGSGYRVRKSIRDHVVFASQNLIADPPFSKLDLVSCRNLLIYLDPVVQQKVIELFHFALSEDGYLFLGSAETVGQQGNLFESVDKKWRLYRRIGLARRHPLDFPVLASRSIHTALPARAEPTLVGSANLGELTRDVLLDQFAPASILVNPRNQILYYYGSVEHYLDQPTGTPTDDLMRRVREGLRVRLRALLQNAAARGDGTGIAVAKLQRDGHSISVTITVNPVKTSGAPQGLLLVSFSENPEASVPIADSGVEAVSTDLLVQQLESELRATRDDLLGTVEELESSNEELKAANEEVMSINEEFQSTNEELETSKEELQSLNEELTTLNNQLEEKLGELQEINDDLENLFHSTDIATIFLNSSFSIKRFTPPAKRLFALIGSDIGRPISDITRHFSDSALLVDAKMVLDKLAPIEEEVTSEDGRRYVRRILPYRTQENRIDGVVLTFVDITERERAEEVVRESEKRHRQLIESIADGFFLLDREWHLLMVNSVFLAMTGRARDQLQGQRIMDCFADFEKSPLFAVYSEVMNTREPATVSDLYAFNDGGAGWYDARVYPVEEGIFVIMTDVTERRRAEQLVELARDESMQANAAKSRFLSAASHDLRQPLQALALCRAALEEASSDPQVLEIAEYQQQAVISMQGMLDGLLDLSKIESGAIKVNAIDFPIEDLLQRIRQDFLIQAKQKGLELRVVSCAQSVHSDPALLARVVNNFVANAIKFTVTGKVLIGCRRHGGQLRIEVWDTGVGIPHDKLGLAFEAFYQIGNPARESDKGFGLGLSVAGELAKLLEHSLDARSTVDEGSMFAVEVPLVKRPKLQPLPVTGEVAAAMPPEGAVVLVVEDDPIVQVAMSMLLENMGLRVITAESGRQALEQVQALGAPPDMIIADYCLPEGSSGVDVIHRIREFAGDLIPAALVTAEMSPEGVQEMESSGVDIFYKPVDIDAFKALIYRVLG